jgi:hypothetical protein
MSLEPIYYRFPKVPIERRAAAFGIDFVGVWFVSALLGLNVVFQAMVFILLWLGMRVILVSSNQGQSLGRWGIRYKSSGCQRKDSWTVDVSQTGRNTGILCSTCHDWSKCRSS